MAQATPTLWLQATSPVGVARLVDTLAGLFGLWETPSHTHLVYGVSGAARLRTTRLTRERLADLLDRFERDAVWDVYALTERSRTVVDVGWTAQGETVSVKLSGEPVFRWWGDIATCDGVANAVVAYGQSAGLVSGYFAMTSQDDRTPLEIADGIDNGWHVPPYPCVRTYGWLTVLGPAHVARLGGSSRLGKAPCDVYWLGGDRQSAAVLLRGAPTAASFFGPPARTLRKYLRRVLPPQEQTEAIREARLVPELLGHP